MIELRDGDYIVGVWIAPLPPQLGRPGNLMATLWRRDDIWHLVWRFRYFVDDKVFESADEKSWYRTHAPCATLTEAVATEAAESIFALARTTPTFHPVYGDVERFQEVMMTADEMCVRVEDPHGRS